ncbi:MAG: AAA family ATPase [Candidatus Lokiarchaeota archaeon]|nr:AAA family ATPase [Candidatus Lokiarchaeota archaeon]
MKILAVVGKGGVGKTTMTYLIAQDIINRGFHPLLIDADPTMSHLMRLLGIKTENTIENIRQGVIRIATMGDKSEKINLAQNIDEVVSDCIIKSVDYSLMVIGQPQSAGCFCPSNTLLRNVIENISDEYEYVIIDCEAGMEQIHRSVVRSIDFLLIISDSSLRSLETAVKIKKAAKKYTKFKDYGVIVNRLRQTHKKAILEMLKKKDLNLIGTIREVSEITNLELEGKSLSDLPTSSDCISDLSQIVDKIIKLMNNS